MISDVTFMILGFFFLNNVYWIFLLINSLLYLNLNFRHEQILSEMLYTHTLRKSLLNAILKNTSLKKINYLVKTI